MKKGIIVLLIAVLVAGFAFADGKAGDVTFTGNAKISYDYDLDKKDTGFVITTVQFDCHDKSFKKARQLSRAVKRLFQDYSGDMYGVNIQATFIQSDIVFNNSSSNRFDAEDVIHVIEFEFHYNEK